MKKVKKIPEISLDHALEMAFHREPKLYASATIIVWGRIGNKKMDPQIHEIRAKNKADLERIKNELAATAVAALKGGRHDKTKK